MLSVGATPDGDRGVVLVLLEEEDEEETGKSKDPSLEREGIDEDVSGTVVVVGRGGTEVLLI